MAKGCLLSPFSHKGNQDKRFKWFCPEGQRRIRGSIRNRGELLNLYSRLCYSTQLCEINKCFDMYILLHKSFPHTSIPQLVEYAWYSNILLQNPNYLNEDVCILALVLAFLQVWFTPQTIAIKPFLWILFPEGRSLWAFFQNLASNFWVLGGSEKPL